MIQDKEGAVSGGIENFKFLIKHEKLEHKVNVTQCQLLVSLCAKPGFM